MSDKALSERERLLIELTADIVTGFVSNNPMRPDDVPAFIDKVHASISGAAGGAPEPIPEQKPAVPISKSIKHDALTCLECGEEMATLKRHIRIAHDLEPDVYRRKWGLPADYPINAPAYAERRSQIAKARGLGTNAISKTPNKRSKSR